MTGYLIDTVMMLGILGGYAVASIALSVCAMAAYLKWQEHRR